MDTLLPCIVVGIICFWTGAFLGAWMAKRAYQRMFPWLRDEEGE